MNTCPFPGKPCFFKEIIVDKIHAHHHHHFLYDYKYYFYYEDEVYNFSNTYFFHFHSDYARPHAGLSPGSVRPPTIGLPPALPGAPPGLDLLHFGSMAALYPPGSQERMELEARERELRELRDREISDRIKQEIMKRPMNPLDAGHPHSLSPHWISASRFPGFSPPVSLPSGFHGHGLYAPSPSASSALIAERDRLERLGKYMTHSHCHGCCHALLSVHVLSVCSNF